MTSNAVHVDGIRLPQYQAVPVLFVALRRSSTQTKCATASDFSHFPKTGARAVGFESPPYELGRRLYATIYFPPTLQAGTTVDLRGQIT